MRSRRGTEPAHTRPLALAGYGTVIGNRISVSANAGFGAAARGMLGCEDVGQPPPWLSAPMDGETMMAEANDDTKPTVEDVDRVIREHDRIKVTGQDMRKAIEERIAKGRGASKDVQIKKGESLWDRADRVIDAAEKGKENESDAEK